MACIGLLAALLTSRSENAAPTVQVPIKVPGAPVISESTNEDFYDNILEKDSDDKNTDWDKLENEEIETTLNYPWEKNVRLPKSVLPIHYNLFQLPLHYIYSVFSFKIYVISNGDFYQIYVIPNGDFIPTTLSCDWILSGGCFKKANRFE